MSAVPVNDQNFDDQVIKSSVPVLVDFYATWCGPCQMASPIIDELANQFEGKAKVVKIDIDENSATATKYNVMSLPTMILFNHGLEVNRKVGFGGRTAVEKLINDALN